MAQRPPKSTICLLHFIPPYHYAQHDISWTTDLDERLKQLFTGAGARLLEVVTAAGITCNAPRLYPVCAKRSGRSQ